MRRPLSFLPALVAAAAATAAPALPAPASATPATGTRVSAAAPENDDPLQVSIERLTPGEIPEQGPVRMQGTITNVSDERWRAVNVHAFVGYVPMTTSEELEAAREVPADAEIGQRIFIPGTFDDVGGLDPGESATYEILLKRNQIPAETPGVYWFGAHALGNTTDARDAVADGRARTFLPLLPTTAARTPVDTSVVIPLRHPIAHTRSGRLTGEPVWARDLGAGGYLRRLVALGAAARNRPVAWLVDPAVRDAVRRLVDGNPPRSLAAPARGGGPDSPDDGPSEGPSGATSAQAEDESAPPPGAAAAPGEVWLEDLAAALEGGRVLSLPYGDVDVSAAHDHGPDLLQTARMRAGDQLDDVPTLPAVAPPSGYLSTEALAALPEGTHALLTDRMLPEGSDAEPLDVDDRRVLFAPSDVAAGGPGPDDPLGTVAVRQRILAEAAVRQLDERRAPLLVVLPQTWSPDRPSAFWQGLGVRWLTLTDPTSLVPEGEVATDELDYPPEQRAAELPAANFVTAEELESAGRVLANVLTDNDEIDQEITDEVLTAVSYGDRRDAEESQLRTEQSLHWVERRSRAVRVKAPPGVTLSSAAGGFATTLVNRLDHPVTITLKAVTDASLSVDTPPTIDLAPRGRQTVVLQAATTTPGVHYVRLVVTDEAGAPLGSSATLPVRSAQVSRVIWLILGVGVGLLFLAIAVRLVRRIRSDDATT
ncbi:DUF6049 family protein [Nocardioides sp. GXQ0305]|uniref:DUF6049 family protein n=1 Tax=Nocardioides sp. GXQ0305 TaxID=3423912 RepID=UPI003D7EFF5E